MSGPSPLGVLRAACLFLIGVFAVTVMAQCDLSSSEIGFDIPAADLDVADSTKFLTVGPGMSQIPGTGLIMIKRTETDPIDSYGVAAWLREKVRISSGFALNVTFEMRGSWSPGFTVTIQNNSPSARGGGGVNRGFTFPKSIAFVLDTTTPVNSMGIFSCLNAANSMEQRCRRHLQELDKRIRVDANNPSDPPTILEITYDAASGTMHSRLNNPHLDDPTSRIWVPGPSAQFTQQEIESVFPDGTAWVGFTSSTRDDEQRATFITVKKFEYRSVAMSAKNSIDVSGPLTLNAIANSAADASTRRQFQLYDACGRIVKGDPYEVKYAAVTTNAPTFGATGSSSITLGSHALYSLAFYQSKTGTYPLEVRVNGALSLTYTITIAPSAPSDVTSKANGLPSGGVFTAGERVTMTVELRDRFNNIFVGTSPRAVTARFGCCSDVSYSSADTTKGIYTFNLVTTIAAAATSLEFKVGGQSVSNSPFEITVKPGRVTGATSFLGGSGLSQATVGSVSTITISLQDEYGNSITTENPDNLPTIYHVFRDEPTKKMANTVPQAEVLKWSNTNRYEYSYSTETSGQYNLVCTINGVSCLNSNNIVTTVQPGAVVGEKTVVTAVTPASEARAGVNMMFTLDARDSFGNSRRRENRPEEAFEIQLSSDGATLSTTCVSSSPTPVSDAFAQNLICSYHSSTGLYRVRFVPLKVPTLSGVDFTVSVTAPLSGGSAPSAFSTVIPAAASSEHSQFTNTAASISAGNSVEMIMTVYDRFLNPAQPTNTIGVVFSQVGNALTPSNNDIVTISGNVWKSSYRFSTATQYTATGRIDGRGVDSRSVSVTFGPVDFDKCSILENINALAESEKSVPFLARDEFDNPSEAVFQCELRTGTTTLPSACAVEAAVPAVLGSYTIKFTAPAEDVEFTLYVETAGKSAAMASGRTYADKKQYGLIVTADDTPRSSFDLIAGVPQEFFLQNKDENGANLVDRVSWSIIIQDTTGNAFPGGVQTQIVEARPGRSKLTLTGTLAQGFKLRLYANAVETENSKAINGYAITTRVGSMSYVFSTVSITNPKPLNIYSAGSSISISVRPFDVMGNPVEVAETTSAVARRSTEDGTSEPFAFSLSFEGTHYKGTFEAKVAGDYGFVVGDPDGQALAEVPFTVSHTGISANSFFDGDADDCFIDGVCRVSFKARDAYNNSMLEITESLTLLVAHDSEAGVNTTFTIEPTSVMLNVEGDYIVSYTPTKLGDMKNVISLFDQSGDLIASKEIDVTYAREIDIEHTTVDGIQDLAAPGNITLTVVTKDAYENPWAGQTDNYEISLVNTLSSTATVMTSDDIVFAADMRSFTVTVFVRVASVYAWQINIGDVNFGSSADKPTFPKTSTGDSNYVDFKVSPGAAHGPNTVVSRPGALEIVANNAVSFTITARDVYGNPLESEDPNSVFSVVFYEGRFGCNVQTSLPEAIEDSSWIATSFFTPVNGTNFVNYGSGGVYNVNVKTTRANTYEGNGARRRYFYYVLHNNQLVRECASLGDAIQYTPGPLSGPNAILSGVNFEAVEAGTSIEMQIAYADEFGNEIRYSEDTPSWDLPYVGRFTPTGCDGTALSSDFTIEVGPQHATLSFSPTEAKSVYVGVKIGQTEATAAPILYSESECVPFHVHHSHPDHWKVKSGFAVKSGSDSTITLESFDVYNNRVDLTVDAANRVNEFSYEISFRLVSSSVSLGSSPVVYVQETSTVSPAPGQVDLSAPLAVLWPGTYEVLMTIVEPISRRRDLNVFSETVTVAVGVCAQTDPLTPFQCRDFSCVAGPEDCPEYTDNCAFKCLTVSGGEEKYECVSSIDQCACSGTDKECKIGDFTYCARSTFTCPTSQFPSVPTPSQRHCNPGYVLCPDRVTCAESEDQCIDYNGCPAGKMFCPTGQCVNSGDECPSLISCPASKPILCQDNTCASSTSECASVRPCLNPRTKRCPDGSCATDASQCPVSVVCTPGSVLCESGFCAPSADMCPSTEQCSSGLIRCPDGSCVADQAFCPTRVSCPVNTFLCPDGSTCVNSIFQCPVKPACSADRPVLCPSGACAASMAQCSTAQTCPSDNPVRCADNSCVAVVSRCSGRGTTQCPDTSPVRCGDGTCHKSIESCSSLIQCPVHRPLKCPDSKCVSNPADCGSSSQFTCGVGQVKCHSGMCAPDVNSCPTVVSCQPDQTRCPDGTCRKECVERALNPPTCPEGQIQCPLAEAGIHCAASLAACPQGFACPRNTPIRCSDMSCATHVSECSKPDSDFIPHTRVPCGGGSWASQQSLCGAPVTCPASQPAKCWDESCRRSAADCPPMRRCPFDFPFLCSDGSCQLNVWSCATARCTDPARSLRCPAFSTSRGCVEKVEDCLDVEDLNANVLVKCPAGQRCWDGSCASELRLCPPRRCPVNQPFLCRNGACAADEKHCSLTNGCPWDLPVFCAASGTCVASASNCGSKTCDDGLTLCADGTCRPADECLTVTAFGCPSNTPVVCHDKSCAAEPVAGSESVLGCIDTGDKFNACPASRPFRCPGGFCAVSSTRCPVYSESASVCRVDADGKPMQVRCDDGSCAYSFAQCPVVKPCAEGEYRCGDGTCKPLPCDPRRASCRDDPNSPFVSAPFHGAKCSGANTCPAARPYRCQDGLCAASAAGCVDNYPVVLQNCCAENLPYTRPTSSRPFGSCGAIPVPGGCVAQKRNGDANLGCPEQHTRCSNGICLPPGSSVTCATYTGAATVGGCSPDTPVKCPDGSCVTSANQCRSVNGCPANAPVLCADGTCKSSTGLCSGDDECDFDKVRCSNGQCADSLAECLVPDVNCPFTEPVRCANGECKRYPALFGAPNQELRCPPTLSCTGPTPVLCGDGSCAPNAKSCRPVFACASGVRCPVTGECAETLEACPTALSQCPMSMPIMCPNGACTRSTSDCLAIGESPRRIACPASKPIRCMDGSCADSPAICVAIAVAAFSNSTGGSWSAAADAVPEDACLDGGYVCPNGLCASSAAECSPVPACAIGLRRCGDGSCASSCPASPACDVDLFRCEDGTCRHNGTCPIFDGCPSHLPFSCYAEIVQCVASAEDCNTLPEGPNVTSSSFSTLAFLDMSLFESEELDGQEVCASNCERQVPASAQTVVASSRADTAVQVSSNVRGIPRMSLSVPAGAFAGDTKISVHPVPSSLLDLPVKRTYTLPYAFNLAPNVRGPKPGVFASKVISTPFHCAHTSVATGDAVEPSTPLVASSFVDITTYDGTSGGGSGSDPTVFSCELQGDWDAAILNEQAPNVVTPETLNVARTRVRSAHRVLRAGLHTLADESCAGEVAISGAGITIDMEACGAQYSLVGEYVSTTQISPWSGSLSEQKIVLQVQSAEDSSIEQKKVCVFVQRISDLAYFAFPAMFGNANATDADLLTCATAATGNLITAVLEPNTDPDAVDPCSRSALITNQIPKKDICLAKYNSSGLWECIYDRDGRIANPVWYTGMGHTEVTSAIPSCTGVNAFAFVHEPLPDAPQVEESRCGWWCRHGTIVIIVLCVVAGLILLAILFGIKVYRDRVAYKKEQARVNELKERAKDLNEYAGGLGLADADGEVVMVANPLVLQLQELQKELDTTTATLEATAREEEFAIQRLEMQRQRIREEMRRVDGEMKKQEAAGAGPKAQRVEAASAPQRALAPQSAALSGPMPAPSPSPSEPLNALPTSSSAAVLSAPQMAPAPTSTPAVADAPMQPKRREL